MIKQTAHESVHRYHARFLSDLEDTSCDVSTVDTETYISSKDWSTSLTESISEEVLLFIKGLKCPRCREFVMLRRPQSLESAFRSACDFETCYSRIPSKKVHDESAVAILQSRAANSGDQLPSNPFYSARTGPLSEEESSVVGEASEGWKLQDEHHPTTVYFNSLLGRMQVSGVPQRVIEDFRKLFAELQRNYIADIEAGVMEQNARDYLAVNRKYQHDHTKHELHPYETHMTIKLAACTRFWHVGMKIPLMAVQIKKPTWMRRLFHKLPMCLSSPGLSYNP